jgi:anti-sigma regulatory factor (Ser/Thr protein kinase)
MSELLLPAATESVPVARRFARDELRSSAADVDTVVLLVSELVTNAVLHARSDVLLTVEDQGAIARVEVSDASPLPPRLRNFAVESATGRGMKLLDQLAQRWGAVPRRDGGKVVWFEVGAPSEVAWQSYADTLLAEDAP